jgi:hypothetical protein
MEYPNRLKFKAVRILAALAVLPLTPVPARAISPCVVTSTADAGTGTLRDQIDNNPTCDLITFDPSIVPGTITVGGVPLTILRDLTINGPGADKMTVDGASVSRVFKIDSGAVTISGLTIAHGNPGVGSAGGGIYVEGLTPLTITNSTLSDNTANYGGGIFGGTLTIDNVTFARNAAPYYTAGGDPNAGGVGGAIFAASVTATNCTFAGNHADNFGVAAAGAGVIGSSTFFGNSGAGTAVGVTLKNTIIAGSIPANCIADSLIDGGGNLSSDGSCPATFKFSNTDPKLGPLANNGGPTQTMALLSGSPAIDAAVTCPPPAADQRGVSRPQGGGCDIGAFELVQQPGPVFSGFFAPVSNPPMTNIVKAGQAVPVKFSLGGDWGLNILASGYPASQQISCPLAQNTSSVTDTLTAGNSSLTYDSTTQTYTYVWKTEKAWANTCRQLMIVLGGNNQTTKTAAFAFSK